MALRAISSIFIFDKGERSRGPEGWEREAGCGKETSWGTLISNFSSSPWSPPPSPPPPPSSSSSSASSPPPPSSSSSSSSIH